MGFASDGVNVQTWSFVARTSIRLVLTGHRPANPPERKAPTVACKVEAIVLFAFQLWLGG